MFLVIVGVYYIYQYILKGRGYELKSSAVPYYYLFSAVWGKKKKVLQCGELAPEALFSLSFCLLEFDKTPSAGSVTSPAHAAV